jgi:hypothetical protein
LETIPPPKLTQIFAGRTQKHRALASESDCAESQSMISSGL